MLQSNRQYFLIIFFLSSLISFSQGTVGEVKIIDEDQLPKWVKVEKIEIVNNKITRPWVILNQFEYQVGDSLQRYDFISKTLQSRKNLVNRQLFTYIDFKVETVEEYKVILTVTVKERWNI